MPSGTRVIVAFDLYGTLLSTESIAKNLATHFDDEKAQSVASAWRRYQLEYTWRLNSMNQYEPFSTVTRNSLSHTLAEHGLELDDTSIKSLMEAYDSLSTFPDVTLALEGIKSHASLSAVIFSNGTDNMVETSVKSSPDLGPHASVFCQIVTVEAVKKYKPHPDVYYHLAEKVGKGKSRGDMEKMWLVSGNPFDIVGSRAIGMQAVWVDRVGNGWTDQLVPGVAGKPTVVVQSLDNIAEIIMGL
ncbi:hypothetical protein MMC11_007856 [Xylographa trunciseda]|nr:hypothetical protein [Xylographa trunciseda]